VEKLDRPAAPARIGNKHRPTNVISNESRSIHNRSADSGLARTVLLTPFLLIGFALSGPARRLLDNGWTRGAVLAVSAASGVLLIGRVLLSRG
jgi:hypothetical protein